VCIPSGIKEKDTVKAAGGKKQKLEENEPLENMKV